MAIFYVSDAATNGVPVGSASGNGSKTHPFLTLDQALAAAKSGDAIRVNGTFRESVTIANGVSIEPVATGSAVIDGTVTIAATAGQKITIGAVTIDAKGAANAIMLDAESQAYSLTLKDTRLADAAGYGVSGQANLKANLTTADVDYSAAKSQGFVGLTSLAAGSVNIWGGAVNVSDLVTGRVASGTNQVGGALIGQVEATAAGISVKVDGVTAKASLDAADSEAAGLQVMNVAGASIEDCAITLSGSAKDAMRGIALTYDFLHPLDSSGAVIAHNTVRDYDPDRGVLYYIGANPNPGATGFADNAAIYDNVGIGNATAAQQNDLHGVLVGFQSGARVEDNQMTDTALAYPMKDDFGTTLVRGNTDRNTALKSWYTKGGSGVEWVDNTSIQDAGFDPVAFEVGPDIEGGVTENGSAALVEGNKIDGTVLHGAQIAAGSSATFAGGKVVDGAATLTAQAFAQLQVFVHAAAAMAPSSGAILTSAAGGTPETMAPTILSPGGRLRKTA